MRKRSSMAPWAVFALYVVLTLVFAYPLSLHPQTDLFTFDSDAKLIQWILGWDVHAFVTQPLHLFDANIFAPLPNTLAYAEHLLGSAIIAAPIIWLTDNYILAVNVVALLSIPLSGLGAYLLTRRLGISRSSAILAGLIFAFAPPRFFRLPQLQLTTIQWLPFCLAYLHTYLDHHRPKDLRIALLLFSLQALSGGHGAVFLAVSIVALLGYRFALGEPLAVVRRVKDMGVAGAVALLPTVLVFLPYVRARTDAGLARTLAGWDTSPASFLASPSHLHQWIAQSFPNWLRDTPDAYLFPGYLPLLLPLAGLIVWLASRSKRAPTAARPLELAGGRHQGALRVLAVISNVVALCAIGIGIWALTTDATRARIGDLTLFTVRDPWRPWLFALAAIAHRLMLARRVPFAPVARLQAWWTSAARQRNNAALFYTLLALGCGWLLLGPPWGIWQWVYDWPVLNFIRVPTRVVLVLMLALAVLSGMALDRLTRGWPRRRHQWAATALGVLLLAEFGAFPLAVQNYSYELPAIDRWLTTQPTPFTVAEAPMPVNPENYSEQNTRNATYMLHSMAHWQKTVHGFSGVLPADHQRLYETMSVFPSLDALDQMRALGVTLLVYHADFSDPAVEADTDAVFADFSDRLTLVHQESDGRVYRLE